MKIFTFLRPEVFTKLFIVFAGTMFSAVLVAQPTSTITAPSAGTTAAVVGGTVSFTAQRNGNNANWPGGNGNFTYTWNFVSGPGGGLTFTPASSTTSGSSSSTTATFTIAGTYTVSCTINEGGGGLTATSAVKTITVFLPNLYSASGSGTIKAYNVDPITGAVLDGPADIATPSSTTAGLGKNKLNVNDAAGSLYYILNTSNNSGIVQIRSVSPTGTNDVSVGSIDMNGGGNNTSLEFVRLGFDKNGKGWIIAGDGITSIYISSFQGNGSNPITNINTFGNNPLTINGGNAADFQNGDLAISGSGVLYALANVTGGNTYIYTLNSLVTPTALTKKWTVQTNGGVFTGTSVNGVAWTLTGSLHISTSNGIYFIDQTTANQLSGTVQATQISSISGLTDMASSEFPSASSLPVRFGEFSVIKSGNNAGLTWTTYSEINNDRFEVERSTDAVYFESVGSVKSKGNTGLKQTYTFNDPLLSSAPVLYYRVKQVDFDGSFAYTIIVPLRLKGTNVRKYSLYPNPFVSNIKLQVTSDNKQPVSVRISSINGQLLINKGFELQKGENILVVSNMETLKKGIYILEISGTGWKETQRIIKN